MSSFTVKLVCWAWVVFLILSPSCSAEASTKFDSIPVIQQNTQHLTTSDLADAVSLFADILAKHNIRRESSALQQYVQQLRAVLQQDCCDYFTALPTVKGLTAALSEVLQLRLAASLRPVLRRSYVAAIWLLQRSRFFKWDAYALHKSALSGMYKLFDAHMDAASGRPISFHHISKTGGTSLCSVAWDNGCRGPGMSKKDNCLLDTGLDGPVWVLRHNVTAANSLTAIPPPPPPPPVMADSKAEEERLLLAAASHKLLKQRSYGWFMYDCPVSQQAGRIGRGCSELQEAAISKSATFFAHENTLPTEHGSPKVCEAFINVVILRESVSEAVSLMSEASLVYTRLLKQHRVLGWTPPKWDLAWWQQWAPLVVNSYATRTLLGAAAYCPAAPATIAAAAVMAGSAAAGTAQPQPGQAGATSSSSSSNGGTQGSTPWAMSADDVRRALEVLASFDVVLDLGSLQLMDVSLAQLLGWSVQSYTRGRHQRSSQAVSAPTWEQLELLARQLPPPLKELVLPKPAGAAGVGGGFGGSGSSSSSSSVTSTSFLTGVDASPASATAGSGRSLQAAQEQQQLDLKQSLAAPADSGVPSTSSSSGADLDIIRRLIGEVQVRQVYSSHGVGNVLLPLSPEVPLMQPPTAVVTAAVAALAAAQQAPMVVEEYAEGSDCSSHLLVKLQVGQIAQSASTTVTSPGHAAAAAKGAGGRSTTQGVGTQTRAETTGVVLYHVWLKHGVVLSESQYQQLLRATSADAQLYKVGHVMQALDAGWASVLGQQRKVRKMMQQVQEEAQAACGFAGLNHMQA